LVEACKGLANVEVLFDTVLEGVNGDATVTGIDVSNVKTKDRKPLDVSGVFIAAGLQPASGFARGFIKMDEKGFIKTDEYMRTNVPGVYAAGDVRVSPLRQIVTAAADGAVAAHSAWEHSSG